MIRSMTGQGRASQVLASKGLRITVEARSLNHRYLDTSIKLPDQLAGYEEELKQEIKSRLSRGSVCVSVHVEESQGKRLTLDENALDSFLRLLKQARKKVPLSGELTPEMLLKVPGLIREEPLEVSADKLSRHVHRLAMRAIKDMIRMRRAEGRNLVADLRERLRLISRHLAAIKRRVPARIKKKREKLLELLDELELEIDKNRLLQEVLYFSERFDIHEECVRLENHLKLFRQTLNEKASNGRRLNFTAQEMMKEANTIGAKANDTEITHQVIAIKEEIEKMREQVQNVE